MSYIRKASDAEIIRVVVARRTKGNAFMLSSEDYRKEQEEVTKEVTEDLQQRRTEFVEKYKFYLHGYKLS